MPAGRPRITNMKEHIKKWIDVQPNGCWMWTGKFEPNGHYGTITIHGLTRRAARVVYELFAGPIPEGKELAHSCDNPGCVSPYHLSPCTHEENMQQMMDRNRHGGSKKRLRVEEVNQLRQDAKTMSREDLCKKYDRHYRSISRILNRHSYADIWYPDGTTIPARLIHSETTPRYGAVVPVEE